MCDYLATFPHEFEFTLTPGITAGKKRQRSKYMPNGWPDITGVWRRQVRVTDTQYIWRVVPFFIETKIRPGVPTPEQQNFLNKMTVWGCVAFCAWTLDDVVNRFHGHQAHS